MDIRDEYRAIIKGLSANLEYIKEAGLTYAAAEKTALAERDAPVQNGAGEKAHTRAALCARCELSNGRKKPVKGKGGAHATVVFVASSPEAAEDEDGAPFSGEEGQIIKNIIKAMKLKDTDVYLCHALKCGSPVDLKNIEEAVNGCKPFLEEEISELKPRVIVAFGQAATLSLLGNKDVNAMRGRFYKYNGILVMPTHSTAQLARNTALKSETWSDIQLVMKELQG